jgi:hypothetical protein
MCWRVAKWGKWYSSLKDKNGLIILKIFNSIINLKKFKKTLNILQLMKLIFFNNNLDLY